MSFDVRETLYTWSHGWTRVVAGLMFKISSIITKYLTNGVRSVINHYFLNVIGVKSIQSQTYIYYTVVFLAVDPTFQTWFSREFLSFLMMLMIYNSVVSILSFTSSHLNEIEARESDSFLKTCKLIQDMGILCTSKTDQVM